MFLLNWYRQLLEIRQEFRRETVCQSCETLKQQIETLRYDNQQLLGALVTKETKVETPIDTSNLKPIKPRMIPWSQRRHMLEENDRQQAQLLKKAREEGATLKPETEELERELGIAGQEREAQAKSGTAE